MSMIRRLLPVTALLFHILKIESQTVYQLRYQFNDDDTIHYSAFLLKFNNGVNLVRLKYKDPAASKDIIASTQVTEYFATDAEGKEDQNKLLLKVVKATNIETGSPARITLPVFIYSPDQNAGFHEPAGVALAGSDRGVSQTKSFNVTHIPPSEITRQLVAGYFSKTEEFFKNLFGPGTRGGLRLSPSEQKIKMHVLIVADTKDRSVGSHSITDMNKAIKTYDTIRKFIGIPDSNFIVRTITGDDLDKRNVERAIANLQTGRDDIVIFHFFGHGFRRNTQDPFPHINLMSLNNMTRQTFTRDSLKVIDSALTMQRVFDLIKRKRARLNLVFSDACNINIGTNPVSTLIPAQRGDDTWSFNANNVRALFLPPTRLSLLSNGAKNGEATWSSPMLGSFFTHSLKGTLQVYCSDARSNVSWSKLMTELKERAIDLASKKCCSCCGPACTTKIFCRLSPVFVVQR